MPGKYDDESDRESTTSVSVSNGGLSSSSASNPQQNQVPFNIDNIGSYNAQRLIDGQGELQTQLMATKLLICTEN